MVVCLVRVFVVDIMFLLRVLVLTIVDYRRCLCCWYYCCVCSLCGVVVAVCLLVVDNSSVGPESFSSVYD